MITRSVEYVTGHEDETPRPRGRPKQVTQPYRYAGANLDSATNLYKMGARYYDPATGRFTQRDGMPASSHNPLEYNRYTYVAGNPVNATDRTGYVTLPPIRG